MKRQQTISRTTLIGSVANLFLTAGKIAAGFFGHSAAMLADGVHSLSDFISDIVILVFIRLSSKGRDEDHDYGHGKYETLATLTVSIILLVVAGQLISTGVSSVLVVLRGGTIPVPMKIALYAALISILVKESMYWYTIKVAKAVDSQVLRANAWHHRSDALSSVASLIGIGAAIFFGDKWVILDPIVCCGIGVAIVVLAVKMALPSLNEFLEASLPHDVEKEIVEISQSVEGVLDVHNLQTRRMGPGIIIDEHVVVDPDMKLIDAHNIATAVEKELVKRFGEHTQIHIHLEPSSEAE